MPWRSRRLGTKSIYIHSRGSGSHSGPCSGSGCGSSTRASGASTAVQRDGPRMSRGIVEIMRERSVGDAFSKGTCSLTENKRRDTGDDKDRR